MPLANSGLRIVLDLIEISFWVALMRLLLTVTDRWFAPPVSVLASFRISRWAAEVSCPIVCQLVWPVCWIDTPDRSSSVSRAVQDAWDVYREELGAVPPDVVLALRDAVSRTCVDDVWTIWSMNAEAGLLTAYCRAGAPTAAGSSAFLGRGLLRIRSRRLGGRAVGGRGACMLYGVGQSDEIDVQSAQYFVNSSLAPVLLFRRRLKPVPDVLKGIGKHEFTESRWRLC